LAIVICFRFYADIIHDPGSYLFGAEGDGLKNYYTVAYQVVHGKGMWFNGMLYPYGDHLMFADGQPLLAKVLSWFVGNDVNDGIRVIAIMNMLMIFSLIITAWAVHRLLAINLINQWFAIPFALTIAFLSPQIARFTGHYALAYTFFIPVLWLQTHALMNGKRKWLWSLISIIYITAFGFIQPYYLFIAMLFIGSIIGWEMLSNRFRITDPKALVWKAATLIFPLVIFSIYHRSVDVYTDRPCCPGGTMDFLASFQSVFLPVKEPFYSLCNSYFFRLFVPPNWEAHAYVGMVASFIGLVSIPRWMLKLRSRGFRNICRPVLPQALRTVFYPAVLTLLFAMGLFHALGLNWLAEYVGPMKQFRSLGRLAWIFYYVFSIWAVFRLWAFYRLMRSSAKGRFRYHAAVLVGICAFVWILDAIVNIKSAKELMIADRSASKAFTDQYRKEWADAGIEANTYEAILPLPFNLVGSEKITLEKGRHSLIHSMRASFATGLPMFGGAMSRTSMQVTERSAQLVADPLIPKPILEELNGTGKLLVLWSLEPLTASEQDVLKHAKPLFETSEYRLFELDVNDWKAALNLGRKAALSDTLAITTSFETMVGTETEETVFGEPAILVEPQHPFWKLQSAENDTLVISVWVKVDAETELLPNFNVLANGVIDHEISAKFSPDMMDGWLLVTDTLMNAKDQDFGLQLAKRKAVLARLLVRPIGMNTIQSNGSFRSVNNIPISE